MAVDSPLAQRQAGAEQLHRRHPRRMPRRQRQRVHPTHRPAHDAYRLPDFQRIEHGHYIVGKRGEGEPPEHARLPHAGPVGGENLEAQAVQQGRIGWQLQPRGAETVVKYHWPVGGVAVTGEAQGAAVGQADGERRGASGFGLRHSRKYGRGGGGLGVATWPPGLQLNRGS